MSKELANRLAAETRDGITMPESFLRSSSKLLLWRALAAGDRLHKHAAATRFGWHLSTADRAINELHACGKVHIVGWTRNGGRGPMTKIVAFGPGTDIERPTKLSNAYVCERWRARHHEQAVAIDRRCRIKRQARQGRLPKGNDPLLFAIMGVPR